jgi:DNA-binding XRE family transcriptional regulator
VTAEVAQLPREERQLVWGSREVLRSLASKFRPVFMERLPTISPDDASSRASVPLGRFVIRLSEDRAFTRARSIGARIRAARMRHGWSQDDLASRCGIARANVARLEAGRHQPLLQTVRRVSRALGLGIGELLVEPSYQPAGEDERWLSGGVAEWGSSLRRADHER